MSEAEIQRHMTKAVVALRDAQIQEQSLHGRFQCAYDAARECALAYSGAMNEDVMYAPRRHRDMFRGLLSGIPADSSVVHLTDQMVSQYYLEERLFYMGETAVDAAIVAKATDWAKLIHAAVIERLRNAG